MSHATDGQLVTDVAAQCISSIFESKNFSCAADQPTSCNIPEEKKPEAVFLIGKSKPASFKSSSQSHFRLLRSMNHFKTQITF